MPQMTFVIAALGGIVFSAPAVAADYPVDHTRHARVSPETNPYCGPRCGCPAVTFVRHRELRAGYPSDFDPRAFDGPHYFYGGVKTYARFGSFADYQ
jgi:hypothetical protein